jgi:acylphosphatase
LTVALEKPFQLGVFSFTPRMPVANMPPVANHSFQHVMRQAPPAGVCCRRRSVIFSGRVQGVGFRYTTRNIALQFDVQGYVRNLPDGRVELVMEGPEPEMCQVVEEIRRKMSGFIRGITSEESPATGEFEEFSIRH